MMVRLIKGHTAKEVSMQISTEKYETLMDEIAYLRSKQPKWISVKDRLPEHDGEVLACCSGNIFIANCPEDEWVVYVLEEGGYSETCHVQVDYWMPLPEPMGVEDAAD